MYEFAARLSRGAFASGAGIMTARRLLVVLSQPANPVLIGPLTGVELVYSIRAINIDDTATLHYLFEGDTSFLAPGTILEGTLTFTPIDLVKEIRVTTKPLSVGALDKILLLTFSGATGATFVGDPTVTTILKSRDVSARLVCNPDSFIVVKNTIDNVLDVLRNDTANAPIAILSKDETVTGLRISPDNRTLLMNAGASVRAPFNFNYTALVPTTGETAQGIVTLEIEDIFSASNVAADVPYNSSRVVNVLAGATPDGKLIVSAIGSPSDGNAAAAITSDGSGIRFTVPRDADTPSNSSTLSFTVKHTRTSATLTRTLTVTYTTAGALLGGPGPISRLPWYTGGTQNDYNGNPTLKTIRNGKANDIVMTFGDRGKGDTTDEAVQWRLIRGGDVTGIALQGCLLGIKWASNGQITDNPNLAVVVTYDQWPFFYSRDSDSARQDRFEGTADGSWSAGSGNGTTDDIYDAFGAKLKRIAENYGWPVIVVRMNHECNGTMSYPHAVKTLAQAQPFINATRRAITRIKAAATSTQYKLYFSQNFGRNSTGGNIGPDIWVGKNYCDILSLDFYDRNPPQPITDAASMNRYLNNTRGTSRIYKKRDGVTPLPGCNGPATWADFARQQGVLFAVEEWGVMDPNEPRHDGAEGDNPVFIEGIWNFFNSITDVLAYETYFTQFDSDLGKWPLSRAKYGQLWGA